MKYVFKASAFLCVVVAMLATLFFKGGVAKAGAPPFKLLSSIAAVSAHDIWAVGYAFSGGVEQPLIEHWNGVRWSIVPAVDPNPGAGTDRLEGVTEVSARDVWAVGAFADSSGNELPLIEHWNGSHWSMISSAAPPAGFPDGNLLGIDEVSAHNIWAVGTSFNLATSVSQTLIEHWNGKQWRIVKSPNAAGATSSALDAVTEVSAHNIWAVGSSLFSSGIQQPLIEHWNGRSWSIVASPNTGSNTNSLSEIAEVSAHNIWAVGSASSSLTEHWNGRSWSIVATPDPAGSQSISRNGIAEHSGHDIWAVGSYLTVSGDVGINHTLIEHWDGTAWSIVPSPNSAPTDNDTLFGVVAISAHNAWAVGTIITNGSNAGQVLIEHWNGMQWSIVPGGI